MGDREYVYVPQAVTVSFEVLPALNALESLHQVFMTRDKSGFSQWTHETAASLPADLARDLEMIFTACWPLVFDVVHPGAAFDSFPAYLDALAAVDPVDARDKTLRGWSRWHPEPDTTPEMLLASREAYSAWVARRMAHKSEDKARDARPLAEAAYDLFIQPERLLALTVTRLREAWDGFLAAEWARVLPMLRESAAAYQRLDFSGLSAAEVLQKVTGRDLRDAFADELMKAAQMVFVPSAHIGPYVSLLDEGDRVYVLFGARLPRETQLVSSDLSRAELVTRLSALTDNTRLHILELLTVHDELCAQEIIEKLGLSQSSVSRHLSQLSATGYITERRRDVSKCYSLNSERVLDIVRALSNFLAKKH